MGQIDKQEIIGIDLFCGCGGLTKGLTKAGIQILKGVDIDKTAKLTYEKNNPTAVFVNKDIRRITANGLMKGIKRKGKKLLLAGCAPCQPFSQQNHEGYNDNRKSLMMHFGKLIEALRPDYILVENVPGFQRESNVIYKKFLRMLEKNGYNYDERVINAADYGVPQIRNRYVLLASKRGKVKIPLSSYGTRKRKYRTVKHAIAKYPKLKVGERCKKIPNHSSFFLSPKNMKRLELIPKNGGSRISLPKSLQLDCHKGYTGHTDVYGRMWWKRPSPTLTCRCTSLSNGRFAHPFQNRAISVREAAALQTFSDNYIFYSCETYNTVHIGNAVPVVLATKLGRAFFQSK